MGDWIDHACGLVALMHDGYPRAARAHETGGSNTSRRRPGGAQLVARGSGIFQRALTGAAYCLPGIPDNSRMRIGPA